MQPPGYGGPPGGQRPHYPQPGAQQPGHPQQGQPQQQAGYPQQQAGYPGQPAGYGQQPGQYPGAPQQGAPQQGYPGMPQGYPGAAGFPGAQAYPGAQQPHPAAQQHAAFAMGGAAMAPQTSYGGAQKALSGASTMLKVMRIVFIAIGALCILGGIALVFTVDVVSGASTAVSGVILIGVALLVLPKFFGMMGQATAMVDGLAAKEQLAHTGTPATGRLIHVQQTGRLVNYNPEIQATVEVQHPQFGVYQVQTTAVIPQIAIPRAQPGAQVQVRVDPQNRNEIALVF